jgi:hypothetical protein
MLCAAQQRELVAFDDEARSFQSRELAPAA